MGGVTVSPASPEPNPRTAPERFEVLDGIRGAAALWVLLSHTWLQAWPVSLNVFPPPLIWRWTGWMLYARFAVDVFLVLSGFCLMLGIVRRGRPWALEGGALGFLKRRAWRILPPYYFACALSLLLIATLIGRDTGTHWDISVPVTPLGIFAHALLIQDALQPWVGAQVNHAFWSIAVEWHLYFLFPALIFLWRRGGTAAALGAALVVGYGVYFLTWHTGITGYYLILFALGMGGASLCYGPDGSPRTPAFRVPLLAVTGVSIIVVSALCGLWGWRVASQRFYLLDPLVGIAATALIVAVTRPLSAADAPLRRVFSHPLLVRAGVMGYSIYLIHAPLLQVVWQYGVAPWGQGRLRSFVAFLVVGTPLILLASYGFFLCCERPFLRRRP